MQLNDKVIIITGGCQGLGRAMAEYLAAKGAKLALIDLNPEKLELAVAACQGNLQFTCGYFGVVKKQFVKIPHAVKKQGVRVFVFNGEILLKHGGHFAGALWGSGLCHAGEIPLETLIK